MIHSDRLNRRQVLVSIPAVSSLGLAGCSGGNGNGNGGASTATDASADGSQRLGEYGLPHCDTGEYVFHIMEIEEENSVRYANFTAKNLTTDDVKLFAVHTNGDEYIVDTRFQPQETKTIPIKGGFLPGDEFSLEVSDHDGGYDGMKCSTGSPSEEHLGRKAESNGDDRDMEDRQAAAIEDDANNRSREPENTGTAPVVYEMTNVGLDGSSFNTYVVVSFERISGHENVDVTVAAELETESGETYSGSVENSISVASSVRVRVADTEVQDISRISVSVDGEEEFVAEPEGSDDPSYEPSIEMCLRNCDR